MTNKTCTKCLEVKPDADFRNRRNECISCEREYKRQYQAEQRKNNPEKIKASKKAFYDKHREEILSKKKSTYNLDKPKFLQKAADYRDKNREKIKNWFREYYKSHNAIRTAKDKKYNEENREKISQRKKEYRNTHRAEIRQRNRNRKVSIKFSKANYTQSDWDYCLQYWNNSCAVCGRKEGENVIIAADHWIPLKKGGLTHKKNILPLCHGINGCNNQKNSKDPTRWIYSKLGDLANEKLHQIDLYFSRL